MNVRLKSIRRHLPDPAGLTPISGADSSARRGFTLIELLVVIMIIALLASITLVTLQGVQETARDSRTRAQIARLNDLIMGRMEEFKTRPMPVKITAGTDPATAARQRVNAVRAMMRMELPDRRTDVYIPNTSGPNFVPAAYDMPALAWPAVSKQYWRKATGSVNVPGVTNWTKDFESAECLYLIISSIHDGDSSALEFFSESEIGDVDGDGMPEILDAWGNPILFLRWAPGYGADFTSPPAGYPAIPFFASSLQPLADRDPANLGTNDPFDPLQATPLTNPLVPKHFPLYPLIFSAGPDEVPGIVMDAPPIGPSTEFVYWNTTPPNNPYYFPPAPDYPMGTPVPDANGNLGYADNLHNHFRNVR